MRHEAGSQESTHPFLENSAHAAFRGHGPAVPGMGREKGKGHLGHGHKLWFACVPRLVGKEEQDSWEERREHGKHHPIHFVCPQICWTWLRWC